MQSDAAQLPLTDRLLVWYQANKKIAIGGIILICVVGFGIWLVSWKKEQKELDASQALSSVATPQLGVAGARSNAASEYLKIANTYPNSEAGARALLFAAGSLFIDGKYDEARVKFEQFNREHRDSPFVGEAMLGIAACYDAQGKTNEAVTAYKTVVDRRGAENVGPQAKFALARHYEAQGKPELARPLYEEVARDQYTSIGSEAGIRLEELLRAHPNLITPPPTFSPTMTPMSNVISIPTSNPPGPQSIPLPPATNTPLTNSAKP
jgi:predicted negative regulator of RcsB-dependent stress response